MVFFFLGGGGECAPAPTYTRIHRNRLTTSMSYIVHAVLHGFQFVGG